jgi:hypothetical protein
MHHGYDCFGRRKSWRYSLCMGVIRISMLAAVLGLAVGGVAAAEKYAPESVSVSQLMTIVGKISVKGSMPHVYLCLTTEEGVDYRLVGPLQERIERDHQQQQLRLSGEIVTAALGPGFPAAFWIHTILDVE